MSQIADRIRLQNEWSKSEHFLCPGNPNHKLVSLDRLKCHINTCKEIKSRATEINVYLCQFYEAHMYLDRKERDSHEKNCKWQNLPGAAPYNPTANKLIVIKGEQIKTKLIAQNQQSHYEYALSKGLIKQKKRESQEKIMTIEDFVFIRDPIRINLEQEEKFKQYLKKYNINQTIIFFDEREEDDFQEEEFPKSLYQLEMITLSEWLAQCFQLGIPFNNYFREHHTLQLAQRNEYQKTLRNMHHHRFSRLGFQRFIPMQIFEHILNQHMPVIDYEVYLKYLVEEVKIQIQLDKFQKELLQYLQITTQNHPTIHEKTCFINLNMKGEVLFIIPRINSKILIELAFIQTDLVLMCFKITSEIAQKINPYLSETNWIEQLDESQDIFLWKSIQQQNRQKEIKQESQENQKLIESPPNQIGKFIEEQKLLAERDEYIKLIEEYNQRVQVNKSRLNEIRTKNKSLTHQIVDIKSQLQTLYSQRSEQDELLKQEYKKLNRKIKEFQENRFSETQQSFEKFKENLLQNVREKVKESRNLQEQYNQLQSSVYRKQDDIERLEEKLSKLVEESGNIDIEEIIEPTQYYQAQDLLFMVSESMLCKACNKHRVNILYKPCGHAFLCQVCQDEFLKQNVHYCIYCKTQFLKITHILWENGFNLSNQDYILKE